MVVTDLVGRFSGVVTFLDGGSGVFHSQLERGQVWSLDLGESVDSLEQVSWSHSDVGVSYWPFWSHVLQSIDRLPYIGFYWDTDLPGVQRVVTDLAARLDLVLTTDGGLTVPVAVVMSGWDVNLDVRVEPVGGMSISNLVAVKASLQSLFGLVMSEALVS